MNDSVAAKTQSALSAYVKNAPLTPKLLSKPPFRYLHDLISELIKSSGYAADLFSKEEADAANIKDKEGKIAYLTKIITHVSATLGVQVKVKPQKIVAGLEPEETNAFLQLLAKAAKKQSGGDAQPPSPAKRPSTAAAKQAPAKDSSTKRSKPKLSEEKLKADFRKQSARTREPLPAKSKPTTAALTEPGKEPQAEQTAELKEAVPEEPAPEVEPHFVPPVAAPAVSADLRLDEEETATEGISELASSAQAATAAVSNGPLNNAAPTLAGNHQNSAPSCGEEHALLLQPPKTPRAAAEETGASKAPNTDKEEQAGEAAKLRGSARVKPDPAASDDQADVAEVLTAPDDVRRAARPMSVRKPMRPATARPAPPRQKPVEALPEPTSAPVNIIEEKAKSDEEDEDLIVVMPAGMAMAAVAPALPPPALPQENHGGLVRKMLETKKELELDAASAAAPPVGVPVKEQVLAVNIFSAREKATAKKEIEALRESIQHLCRSTHPLGTTLDYIQEDVDSMNTELEYWVKEYKQYRKRHEEALRATKEALAPLEAQLLHLEASIEDKQDAIAACKAKITENEIIINKLLSNITRPPR